MSFVVGYQCQPNKESQFEMTWTISQLVKCCTQYGGREHVELAAADECTNSFLSIMVWNVLNCGVFANFQATLDHKPT